MSPILFCLALQGAAALIQLDKTNGVGDIVKEQKEKLDRLKNYTFAEFRKAFNRGYEPGAPEFIKRQKIFKKNLQYLIQHNEGPVKTYMVGINKFMDYSE